MTRRRPMQRVLMILAAICYLAAIGCGVAAVFMGPGSGDPLVASLMASVVFFAGVGIVLQVIASSNLPDLRIGRR